MESTSRSIPCSEFAVVTSISFLIICAGVAMFLSRLIAHNKITSLHDLTKRKLTLESKYDFMLGKKWELVAELSRKKQILETLINNEVGYKIKTAAQVCISEEDVEDKISTYLLASGKITLEQDHKIRQKTCALNMDYLSTGVTLGYIDLETSAKLDKGNWTPDRLKSRA